MQKTLLNYSSPKQQKQLSIREAFEMQIELEKEMRRGKDLIIIENDGSTYATYSICFQFNNRVFSVNTKIPTLESLIKKNAHFR